MNIRKLSRPHLFIIGGLFISLFGLLSFNNTFTTSLVSNSARLISTHTSSTKSKSKNAYCAFLALPNEMSKPGEEDVYYIGVRMLAYQLLHDPETKTTTQPPNDFIVLVDPEVENWKRKQLEKDGAIVKEIGHTRFDWIKPARYRWAQVMDKLAVFKLIQYEKILLFDTDVVVVKPLDQVFNDPATQIQSNKEDKSNIKDDEGIQPKEFIMAGHHQGRKDRLNAGFVILKPSIEIFDHYMNVASIEGRFKGGSPEQDLWNYVHRRDGNMPWTSIADNWTINSPTYSDYERGVAALHDKFWRCPDLKIRDILLKSRWKMEGYFSSFN